MAVENFKVVVDTENFTEYHVEEDAVDTTTFLRRRTQLTRV